MTYTVTYSTRDRRTARFTATSLDAADALARELATEGPPDCLAHVYAPGEVVATVCYQNTGDRVRRLTLGAMRGAA